MGLKTRYARVLRHLHVDELCPIFRQTMLGTTAFLPTCNRKSLDLELI